MCCICEAADSNIVTFNKRGDQLNLETGVVTEANGDVYPAPVFHSVIIEMIVKEGIEKLENFVNGQG